MSLRRIVLLSSTAFAIWAAVSCSTDPVFPGDQLLGTFRFEATLKSTDCSGERAVGDAGTFRFEGTFSRNADAGTGWFSLQGFSRGAEYTGQRVVSTHRAGAALKGCGTCEGSQIEETLDTLLLSSSQDELIGRRCSGLLADGGVPEDGGAQPPGPTPNGYDVQRACGTLTDFFIPVSNATSCTCQASCNVVYSVEGIRVN